MAPPLLGAAEDDHVDFSRSALGALAPVMDARKRRPGAAPAHVSCGGDAPAPQPAGPAATTTRYTVDDVKDTSTPHTLLVAPDTMSSSPRHPEGDHSETFLDAVAAARSPLLGSAASTPTGSRHASVALGPGGIS